MAIFAVQNAICALVNGAVALKNVTPGMSLRAIPNRIITKVRKYIMKLLNYSLDYLVETQTPTPPKRPYSDCQFRILRSVIKRKKVSKDYFYGLLNELYDCKTVRQLSYEQMYRVIWILNHWNFMKERYSHE